jgi:hypothetical protein
MMNGSPLHPQGSNVVIICQLGEESQLGCSSLLEQRLEVENVVNLATNPQKCSQFDNQSSKMQSIWQPILKNVVNLATNPHGGWVN